MPPLTSRDVNTLIACVKAEAAKQSASPASVHPSILAASQRCIDFITTCRTQYEAAAHSRPSSSPSPAPPPDFASLASSLSCSPSLLGIASAYQSVGLWLHNSSKHRQALQVLRSALSVFVAAKAVRNTAQCRISIGRVMTAAITDVGSTEEGDTRLEEAVSWWAELRAEQCGKDLELDSAICYHHGQLHARLSCSPPHVGSERRDDCRQCWAKAVEAWTELPSIAFRYPPTARASGTRAMQKHSQHMQQAAEQLHSAAPLLSLYSLHELQMAALQLQSSLYSALLMHTQAAAALLQCGIIHIGCGRLRDARCCLSQAEALRAQHSGACSLLQPDQYSLLHARLSLLLHPTSPPLPPPAYLSSASLLSSPPPLHAAERILHAQQLDLLSLLHTRGGCGSQGLQIGEAAYSCWSSLMRKLAASAAQQERDNSQPAAGKKGPHAAAQRRGAAAADDTEMQEEQERVEQAAERDTGHHSQQQQSRRVDGLLSSVSSLSSPLSWLVVSSFLSSLRSRARQLEQQGDVRQCLDCLAKAATISSAMDATAHGRKAEMLWRRVRLKLGHGDEDSREADSEKAAAVLAEMKREWEAERRADAEASGKEDADLQRPLPQSVYCSRLLHLRHCVELADGCRRHRLPEAALESYTHALAVVDRLMRSSALLAAAPVEEKPATTRTTRGRKGKTAAAAVSPAGAQATTESSLLLALRAQVQGKIASLTLQISVASSSSAVSSCQTLLAASSVFTSHHALVDTAWCCYWQHRGQADGSAASAAWSSSLLRGSAVTTPAASTALLQSGIAACFGLSPPHLMRLLFLSLSAATGLAAPVDAAFALNCSVGITARHAAIAAVTDRKEAANQPASEQTGDGLTAQLDRLQLTDCSDGSGGGRDRECARSERLLRLFSLDGGLQADRRRFEAEFLQRLPLHWTVVTIALTEDSRHLLLSRIRSAQHDAAPILMLRLPLTRAAAAETAGPPQPAAAARHTRSASHPRPKASTARSSPVSSSPLPAPAANGQSSSCHNALDSAMAELAAILKLSGEMNDSVRSSKADGFTSQQRGDWWSGRRVLDDRMRLMLERLEDGCFGAWRGAGCGLLKQEADRQRLQQAALSLLSALHESLSITAAAAPCSPLYPYVEALLSAPSYVTASQLEPGLMYLLSWTDQMSCSSEEAEALRLSQPPAAQHLLARLVRHLQQARQRLQSGSDACAGERQPVILLLSSQLQHLPFESMPMLAPHPITRMPSFLFLLQHMTATQAAVDVDSGSYSTLSLSSHSFILNPSGDLTRTEATFSPLLPALGLTHGLTRSAPSPSTFLSSLSSDFFLYIGHAAGDQYVPLHAVARRASPSVCVLMGCGSGRWKGSSAEYEGWGMVSALLVAGAKAVVGNLWDVTDGEIDRFCVRLLHAITGRQEGAAAARGERQTAQREANTGDRAARKTAEESESIKSRRTPTLSELVVDSRSACHLRYLMGASPVVFGVPVSFPLETD